MLRFAPVAKIKGRPTGPKMSVPPEERARLRGLREDLGWKQYDLAARIGVTPATISNLESGRSGQVYKIVYAEVVRALKAGNAADDHGERFGRVVEKYLRLDGRGEAAVEALIDAMLSSSTKPA